MAAAMARVMAAGAHAVRECTPHVATCTRRGGSPSLPTFEPAIQLCAYGVTREDACRAAKVSSVEPGDEPGNDEAGPS